MFVVCRPRGVKLQAPDRSMLREVSWSQLIHWLQTTCDPCTKAKCQGFRLLPQRLRRKFLKRYPLTFRIGSTFQQLATSSHLLYSSVNPVQIRGKKSR